MPPDNQPEVIVKPENPFYLNPKFLATGLGLILVLIALGGYSFLQSKPTLPQTQQIAQSKPIKPLKGLIGTVLAVDSQKSTLTVNSQGKDVSFPVSNDVLISQIVFKLNNTPGKQFSLPTTILYLEDLEKKKGEEVNLVFDDTGERIVEIQMYNKQRAQK